MFAVIRTGGKQYRVRENAWIEVERLPGVPGDSVTFDEVLMVGGAGDAPVVGAPMVANAAVFAELVEHTRGDKVLIFKKKRRKNHRRLRGHRQDLTVLRITGISPTGERPVAAAAEEPATEPAPSEDAAPAAGEGVDSDAGAEADRSNS